MFFRPLTFAVSLTDFHLQGLIVQIASLSIPLSLTLLSLPLFETFTYSCWCIMIS